MKVQFQKIAVRYTAMHHSAYERPLTSSNKFPGKQRGRKPARGPAPTYNCVCVLPAPKPEINFVKCNNSLDVSFVSKIYHNQLELVIIRVESKMQR